MNAPNIGDVIILRACPNNNYNNDCYFLGRVSTPDHSDSLENLPAGSPMHPEWMIWIYEWHCQEHHYTSKDRRFFHQDDIDKGRITVWL